MYHSSRHRSELYYSYIYIPLGGTKNVAFTMLLVFTFVALWHDLSFRLLAWGWLVSLFIIPELLARYILHPSKVRCALLLARASHTLPVNCSTGTGRGIDMSARLAPCSISS